LIIPLAALSGVSVSSPLRVLLLTGALTVLFDVADMSFLPSLVTTDRIVEGNTSSSPTSSAAQWWARDVGGVLVSLMTRPRAAGRPHCRS